jgi:hypothetical protein
MRTILLLFVLNIPAIVCFAASAYMAINGKDGWGWFLFVGILLAQVFRNKSDE